MTDVDGGSWVEQEAVVLFGGADLSEWHTGMPEQLEGWVAQDGILRNVGNADDLVSNRRFWNFRLQVEYRVSAGGNSGIGLRGRYEVQIYDDFGGTSDCRLSIGFQREETAGSACAGANRYEVQIYDDFGAEPTLVDSRKRCRLQPYQAEYACVGCLYRVANVRHPLGRTRRHGRIERDHDY